MRSYLSSLERADRLGISVDELEERESAWAEAEVDRKRDEQVEKELNDEETI